MEASSSQLRETLKLTSEFLSVNSEDDLESSLEWIAKITGCQSILALNFEHGIKNPDSLTNTAFHLSSSYEKCESDVIIENPVFDIVNQSFEKPILNSHMSLPSCNGIGTLIAERNTLSNNITSVFMVSHDPSKTKANSEIIQFLLPHISNAIDRFTAKQEKTNKTYNLTSREKEVLYWISIGKSNWEAATILGISDNTIKFHVSNICKKLNVRKRGHAIAKAAQCNLIEF